MSDNITLPRELVEEAAESLEWADSQVGGDDCYEDAAKALRAHLAAPEPEKRHPGYILGNHWLETAYERVCAGEGEANVLRDYGLMREEAFLMGVGHLKADNERLRVLLTDASKAVWMNYDGDLLDRIEAALKEVPR